MKMDFATALSDVEQQLALVTQVVQVHTIAVLNAGPDLEYPPNIPVLISNVDQAQRNLEEVTSRFIGPMKQVVQPPTSAAQVHYDDDTETEDEFEESKADIPEDIKFEGQESTTDNGKCDQVEAHRKTEVEPLEKYLMVAKEAGLAVEGTSHNGGDVFQNLDSAIVERWNKTVEKLFKPATQKFRKLLTHGGLNGDVIAGFCQATTLAVSLSTSAKAAIHDISLKSAFPDALHSVRHDCDTLLRRCDGYLSKAVEELAASTHATPWDKLQIVVKRKKIHNLDEKFREICIFIILRDKVRGLKPWSDTQWGKFSTIGRNLAMLVESSFQQHEIAGKFKLLRSVLEQFHVKIPDRSPITLLNGTAVTSPTSLSGLKRSREDQSDPNDLSKRIATELSELDDVFNTELKAFTEMVTSLTPSIEGVNLTSQSVKDIQRIFTKVTEITTRFGKVISRTEVSIAAFGEATKIMVDIICRISCGFLPRTKLKEWLTRLRAILRSSRANFFNMPATVGFEESVNRLQEHWNVDYLDPFVGIRKLVDATDVQGMDSIQQQKAALRLIGHFNHACNTAWGEICQGVAIARENELRAKFVEFGGVLSDWLQRILAAGDQLPGFIQQLTPKLLRIEAKLPNSVPATLFENLKRIHGPQKSK